MCDEVGGESVGVPIHHAIHLTKVYQFSRLAHLINVNETPINLVNAVENGANCTNLLVKLPIPAQFIVHARVVQVRTLTND